MIFLLLLGAVMALREQQLRSLTLDSFKNLTVLDAHATTNGTIQVVLATAPAANLTKIKIVYAAGNPQSLTLLREGIPKLFTREAVKNVTELELVPYGNATEIKVNTLSEGFLYWHPELQRENITNVYRCPNGETECETSLIHACAIKVSKDDPAVYAPFIACMSEPQRSMAPEDASFACSNSTQFMESLRTCALGSEGILLQHQLAEKAKSALTIPAIYINGEIHPFNASTEAVAKDFTDLVCNSLFAQGLLDRDQCQGSTNQPKPLVVPFESLLTPSKTPASEKAL